MNTSLLAEYFGRLPRREEFEDEDAWSARLHAATERFKEQTGRRYTEGTLRRLLDNPDAQTRQAAVLAVGLLGTVRSNEALAKRLRDDDAAVRGLAADALWMLWFRGDSEDNARELRRLVRLRDRDKALAGLTALITRAPAFAEAYNQRAILHFRARRYEKTIVDCQRVLALNPFHFGALAGMAQCLMRLSRHAAALRAFRRLHRIHPTMEGVEETIRALEEALGAGE